MKTTTKQPKYFLLTIDGKTTRVRRNWKTTVAPKKKTYKNRNANGQFAKQTKKSTVPTWKANAILALTGVLVIMLGIITVGDATHAEIAPETPQITETVEVEPETPEAPQTGSTQATEPQYTGVCAEYYDEVAKYTDWDAKTVLAIMRAESGCRADATNTANTDGSIDRGLMQINSIHSYGETSYDPVANIEQAHKIYQRNGNSYTPWSVYNNGAYVKYL